MANITYNDKTQTLPYNDKKFNSDDANEIKRVVNGKADLTQIIDGNQSLGAWNPATNVPALTTTPASVGKFYTVSAVGTSSVTGTAVAYAIGDRIVSNGTVWQYIKNTLGEAYVPRTEFTPIQTTVNQLALSSDMTNVAVVSQFNAYVVTSSGATQSQAASRVTDFIPVKNYGITVSNFTSAPATSAIIAFYDESKTYIPVSGGSVSSPANTVYTSTGYVQSPPTARFVKFSWGTIGATPTVTFISGEYAASILDGKITAIDTFTKSLFKASARTSLPVVRFGTGIINATTGVTASNPNTDITDFMPIPFDNTSFQILNLTSVPAQGAALAFYDVDKVYIAAGSYILPSTTIVADSGLIPTPTNAKFYKFSYRATSLTGVMPILNLVSGDYADKLLNDITTNHRKRILDLEFNGIPLTIGLNKYDKFSLDNRQTVILNNAGVIIGGNGNSGVSGYVRIKPNETLVYPGYISTYSGYSGLYDIDKNPIAGTFVQSGTLTWIEGAYYARFSGPATLNNKTSLNSNYVYEINAPINVAVPYTTTIPTTYLADTASLDTIDIEVNGDSISSFFGGEFVSLSPLEGRNIINNGIGGENVLDTTGRLGAIPYVVAPFTIPASNTESVDVKLMSSHNYKWNINATTGLVESEGGFQLINPFGTMNCEINGVIGQLTFVRADTGAPQSFKFKRQTAGTAVVIPRTTFVKPTGRERKRVYVNFMGTNGGWGLNTLANPCSTLADADNLVAIHKMVADWIRPTGNDFVFLGFYMTATVSCASVGHKAWFEYFEAQMTKEFGVRYIPIRQYLMTEGWKDAGITSLSEADIALVAAGKVPNVLLSDGTHPTIPTRRVMVNLILKRLYMIGVLKNYTQMSIS
jgi:hypothetical protein